MTAGQVTLVRAGGDDAAARVSFAAGSCVVVVSNRVGVVA
jgi:hypothetical protein